LVSSERRRTLRNGAVLILCAALLLSNAGCHRADGPERIAVFGTVTSESGEPISGTISFLPEAGTAGPSATASLVDGVFAFDTRNGPVAGSYRVLVVRLAAERRHKGAREAPVGQPAAAADEDDLSAAEEEWSFSAEVSVDNAEFDFEVPDDVVESTID